MATASMTKAGDGNPGTVEACKAFVAHVESLFMPWNVDALVNGFTEDCVVRFGMIPEFRGREALRAFFLARSTRQKGYRLKKQFRTLMNDIITNIWDGEWEDAATGRRIRPGLIRRRSVARAAVRHERSVHRQGAEAAAR